MNNTIFNQKKDRHGANNPMFGRRHSQEARSKMSQAATLRNQKYKQWKDNQSHLSMDDFLDSQPLKEFITKLIKEEINKLL